MNNPVNAQEGIEYLRTLDAREPVFVLRAQDILAPAAVLCWAQLLDDIGGEEQKVTKAQRVACRMKGWQKRKIPD